MVAAAPVFQMSIDDDDHCPLNGMHARLPPLLHRKTDPHSVRLSDRQLRQAGVKTCKVLKML